MHFIGYLMFSEMFIIMAILPLLTEFGCMEFAGVYIGKFTRKLFKVPGRASIDLLSSWFGVSAAAIKLTEQQYKEGFYTKREASCIMANFSTVSISFALVTAAVIKLDDIFVMFYLSCILVGIIIGTITVRIYPLNKIPNTYSRAGKQIMEDKPENMSTLAFAKDQATLKASKTEAKEVIKKAVFPFIHLVFGVIPVMMAWGTIALIIINFTPVFDFISYPFVPLLNLMGIENASVVASGIAAGFTDQFIPAIVTKNELFVNEPVVRFLLGGLSIVQIISLTEVAVMIMQTKIGSVLGLGKLALIFLERTIIAIPVLFICANIIL